MMFSAFEGGKGQQFETGVKVSDAHALKTSRSDDVDTVLLALFENLVGELFLRNNDVDLVEAAEGVGQALAELRAVDEHDDLLCLFDDEAFQLSVDVVAAGEAVCRGQTRGNYESHVYVDIVNEVDGLRARDRDVVAVDKSADDIDHCLFFFYKLGGYVEPRRGDCEALIGHHLGDAEHRRTRIEIE